MLFKEMLGRLFAMKAFLVAPYGLAIGTILTLRTKVIGTMVMEMKVFGEKAFGTKALLVTPIGLSILEEYGSHNWVPSQMRMEFRKFNYLAHMRYFCE